MKRASIVCLAFALSGAHGAEITNETTVDLTVECRGRPNVDVLPRTSASVELCYPLSLRLGQEAFMYKLGPKTRKLLKGATTRVRVADDGALYISGKGAREMRVAPARKVDLT